MVELSFVITERIKSELNRYPILYTRFNISMSECYNEIFKSYIKILDIIDSEYVENHLFKRREFVMDSILFSLSYLEYICPSHLGNQQIIMGFIKGKLKSMEKDKFSIKKFNENLSEFMIFFY